MPREFEKATEPTDGLELRNSPYTIEGELEGWRRFGRGAAQVGGRRKLMAWILAVILLAPFLFGALHWIVDFLSR